MPRILLTLLFTLLAATGCEDKSKPATLPDGIRTISKNMVGNWTAPGGRKCEWAKVAKGGKTTTASGVGNRTQYVTIHSDDVGGQFHSNKCGEWKRT